jgi:hypothetical protein
MKMEKFLKPRKGQIVRDPVTMIPLNEKGEFKTFIGPQGRYWRKKVKQGDAIVSIQNRKIEKKPEKKVDKE